MPGGGIAYLAARNSLKSLQLDGDEQIGVNIMMRALQEPLAQLANNAALEGAVVVKKVEASKGTIGLNVATGNYEDLAAAGIIDPAKVLRSAVQNAVSVAGCFITTECLITEIPEPPKPAAAHGGHGGMGGMGGMGGGMPGMM